MKLLKVYLEKCLQIAVEITSMIRDEISEISLKPQSMSPHYIASTDLGLDYGFQLMASEWMFKFTWSCD